MILLFEEMVQRIPSIRPNALVLLLADTVRDSSKAESVLTRIEKNDITTTWGVRTLSSTDPKYHPSLYHDGAVWPTCNRLVCG